MLCVEKHTTTITHAMEHPITKYMYSVPARTTTTTTGVQSFNWPVSPDITPG